MSKKNGGDGDRTSAHQAATTGFGSHLLTELRVTNFKSFAGAHAVPLAPITLVYGPNAAGKSSIIQALLLLAQSVQADRFMPQGPLVDVRDFRHVVNGHDTTKELKIGVRFAVEEEDADEVMLASLNDDDREVEPIMVDGGIELTFHTTDHGTPPALRASFEVGKAALVEPYPTQLVEDLDDESGPWGPFALRWTLDLGDPSATETLAEAIKVLPSLQHRGTRESAALLRYASKLVQSGRAKSATLESWVDPVDWQAGLRAPSHLTLAIEPSEAPRAGLAPIGIEGRRLLPEDESALKEMLEQWAAGAAVTGWLNNLKPVTKLFSRVEEEARGILRSNALAIDPSPAARHYRERREWDHRPEAQLVSLGPIRPTPRRANLEDEVSDAALVMIRRLYQNDSLLRGVNEWLERLEIPYSIGVDRLVSQRSGAEHGYTFELTDTRTNIKVTLADVGYGVSQVLPIIVECVGATNSVICIEQPELHLHPRLAANLSELLAETATRGNQIIAETHSENVLLRVQRLIRDGKIAASDVAVLYVDNRPETDVTVTRLRLDDEGDLQDRWPGGFFDDRLADILGMPS